MIKHPITHYSQPTNYSCSPTSLAMLLSFFGKAYTPENIIENIPIETDNEGKELGTITQHLATWCIAKGFEVTMYSADFQIIDLSWISTEKEQLLGNLLSVLEHRNIPSLGKDHSRAYVQSYISFLENGGKLEIIPYMTTKLIDSILTDSPLFLTLNEAILNKEGRKIDTGLRQSRYDDKDGILVNHSVVLFGKNDNENYLLADPWRESENGFREIEPEHLLAAMAGAQMECDNLLFQLKPKEEKTI
jgi:hypothetical protein